MAVGAVACDKDLIVVTGPEIRYLCIGRYLLDKASPIMPSLQFVSKHQAQLLRIRVSDFIVI